MARTPGQRQHTVTAFGLYSKKNGPAYQRAVNARVPRRERRGWIATEWKNQPANVKETYARRALILTGQKKGPEYVARVQARRARAAVRLAAREEQPAPIVVEEPAPIVDEEPVPIVQNMPIVIYGDPTYANFFFAEVNSIVQAKGVLYECTAVDRFGGKLFKALAQAASAENVQDYDDV